MSTAVIFGLTSPHYARRCNLPRDEADVTSLLHFRSIADRGAVWYDDEGETQVNPLGQEVMRKGRKKKTFRILIYWWALESSLLLV